MPEPRYDEAAPISPKVQAAAIEAAQKAVWLVVRERFCALEITIGMRQVDLATRLGVSRAQIHEWMSDHRNISLKAVARLLTAMDSELVCKARIRTASRLSCSGAWIMACAPLLSFADQW